MLIHAPFTVPDELEPFAKLVPFASSVASWERSSPNESDAGVYTDTEETHSSCHPNASYDGTDYSVVGGYADSSEASKAVGSSIGLSLDIFRILRPP